MDILEHTLRPPLCVVSMPPKASYAKMTSTEKRLLSVAVRLSTGIRYFEANPGQDEKRFMRFIAQEVVRRTTVNSIRMKG